MFIECLQRELCICPQSEVREILAQQPQHWSVISIREPIHQAPDLSAAVRNTQVVFSDVLTSTGNQGQGPQPAHVENMLRFAQRCEKQPLLVHCWAGRSRSTAVALILIVKQLWDQGLDGALLVKQAIDVLLQLRSIATPNRLVLRLGLDACLPSPLGKSVCDALMREPRIQRNFHEWHQSLHEGEALA